MTARSPGLDARAAAAAVLDAVLTSRRPLDGALAASAPLAALEDRDRAFAHTLVATTLRRLGQIDGAIARLLERPPRGRAESVINALRLGLCQLLFLGTPAHAAVDTAVRLAVARGGRPYGPLANAVLRRAQREAATLLGAVDPARANTPDWLWDGWAAAYGAETTRRIAEAHMAEPPLDFSVVAWPDIWAPRLEGRVLATDTVRRDAGGRVADLPGYDDGAWWVQDMAASLPARLLGPVAGRTVIDLGAAPGGKTAQLAAAGARVIAVERQAARRDRLAANLARLGLAAELVTADVLQWRPPAAAPLVLLDAPCSATGTIRRHPDVPWTKRPEDVRRLSAVQDRMLDAAADMVAAGGRLVYAVCSLQPEEGPQRVDRFLAAMPEFRREPLTPADVCGLAESITPEGDLRTLPCHGPDPGGMDGFYAARLRRID